MPAEIVLQSPLDMHIHFREGAMLDLVAPLSGISSNGITSMGFFFAFILPGREA